MGFTLTIESSSGQACPQGFSHSDSKALVQQLVERHVWRIDAPDFIGKVAETLKLDLSALEKVAGEEPYLQEYLEAYPDDAERAKEQFARDKEAYEASWQPPGELVTCLTSVLDGLDGDAAVFSRLGIDVPYFLNGTFRHDLADLLAMAQWYQENGEEKVRLFCLT
jgi:hypothetical protein